MYICIYVCMYLSIYLSMYLSLSLSLYMYIYICHHLWSISSICTSYVIVYIYRSYILHIYSYIPTYYIWDAISSSIHQIVLSSPSQKWSIDVDNSCRSPSSKRCGPFWVHWTAPRTRTAPKTQRKWMDYLCQETFIKSSWFSWFRS
jgi:hypothetical protein